MTKCSTLVPAIRQSGFIISVVYKTYTLKDLSMLSKCKSPHTDSPAPQGDSNYSLCDPAMVLRFGSGLQITTVEIQVYMALQAEKVESASFDVCRARSRGLTQPSFIMETQKDRPWEGKSRATGREKVMDLMKSHGTSILCSGIFQQFRTGSEPMSGDRRCRWVFKQPTCKWRLAKIP